MHLVDPNHCNLAVVVRVALVGLAENLVVVVHSPEAAEAENLPADQILDHLLEVVESHLVDQNLGYLAVVVEEVG